MATLINRTISKAVRGTKPQTKARMRSLASVRWVLGSEDGRYVSVDDKAQASLVHDPSLAVVFDGRDNEEMKARFFGALLGVPLTVVLLGQ